MPTKTEPTPPTYETVFENRRAKPVIVYESDGTQICQLVPGEKTRMLSEDPTATFAKYRHVIFQDGRDGKDARPHAILDVRPNWQEPMHGAFPTTFILRWGQKEPEIRQLLDQTIYLMRDIPVIVALNPMDDLAIYQQVDCGVPERVKVPHKEIDGYVAFEWRLHDVTTDRSEPDMLALTAAVEVAAAESAADAATAADAPPAVKKPMTPDEEARWHERVLEQKKNNHDYVPAPSRNVDDDIYDRATGKMKDLSPQFPSLSPEDKKAQDAAWLASATARLAKKGPR